MNLNQQTESNTSAPNIYDEKYIEFVNNVLKETSESYEKEGKCMYLEYFEITNDNCVCNNW